MKKAIPWVAVIVVLIIGYIVYSQAQAPAKAPAATSQASQTSLTAVTPAHVPGSDTRAPATLPASQVIQAKSITVSISNFAFNPGVITITPGTRVTWVNKDSMTHTVTSIPGGPNSGELVRGATYSFTFNTAGTFNYHCAIHPGMTGTVFVQAP